jgi:predicted nucleic acid-binding protein
MALVYFDASALVKLVLPEPENALAVALWNGCDLALSSRLVYSEVCAAVAAAHRNRRLDAAELRRTLRRWDEYWIGIRPVELSEEVAQQAGRLVEVHALRGADGIHLASVLSLADADPVVSTWDRRLSVGASAEGLRTVP